MLIQLLNALLNAMIFRDIDPNAISKVDSNMGFIWFKANGNTYCISIQQEEFDLDKYAEEQANRLCK